MSTQAIIEINGQRFNALNGQLLGNSLPKLARNIDGILPANEAPAFLAAAAKLQRKTPAIPAPQALIADVHTTNHWQGRKPQPTRTLKRSAVKKPLPITSAKIRVQAPQTAASLISFTVQPKASAQSISPQRLARAAQAPMSPYVSRFAQSYAPVAVVPKTVAFTPTTSVPTPPQTTGDLLTLALQHAQSHEEPIVRQTPFRGRVLILTASFAAFLVMVGALASTNLNSAKIHLAAANAGFAVSAPHQTASGFHLGGVSSNAGSVATNYISNSDQRSYTLTQQPSNWDNQALQTQFLQTNASGYQSTVSGGHTVYLYGNSNATWLANGKWYRLTSNGSLSDNQMLDIITGL